MRFWFAVKYEGRARANPILQFAMRKNHTGNKPQKKQGCLHILWKMEILNLWNEKGAMAGVSSWMMTCHQMFPREFVTKAKNIRTWLRTVFGVVTNCALENVGPVSAAQVDTCCRQDLATLPVEKLKYCWVYWTLRAFFPPSANGRWLSFQCNKMKQHQNSGNSRVHVAFPKTPNQLEGLRVWGDLVESCVSRGVKQPRTKMIIWIWFSNDSSRVGNKKKIHCKGFSFGLSPQELHYFGCILNA